VSVGATGLQRSEVWGPKMPTPDGRSVALLVLTHNAPVALERCLKSIAAQSELPDSVLVVDNDSNPPVTREQLPPDLPPVRIVRSDFNSGPAGGWALALKEFLAGEDDLAWVMDDDNVPDATCLAELSEAAVDMGHKAFVFPRWVQPDGNSVDSGAWCGFLISRTAVEAVGLPREDLFWFEEDSEYTRFRLPRAGYPSRRVWGAVVHHLPARHHKVVAAWRYYYEARNLTWMHMYVMRRLGWYPRLLMVLVGRAVLEADGRTVRLMAIGKGLWHGATKQLGIRYPIVPLHEVSPGDPSESRAREVLRRMIRRAWTPDLADSRGGSGAPGRPNGSQDVEDGEDASALARPGNVVTDKR
jgi:rhamnopyranosyl-N-acetylglucosaminyl-diphospho-decaprenol beta-1,3/1,4-galactofuranosyltransferase